ncbi:hypothetical protein HZB78_01945 [Candidatus Collierbacteria bacterium]|nr:hypothetical protein [Candidatus Collierbacteria bacterium]
MIRTQVYIPDDLHKDMAFLMRQEGMNFSQLVREGVKTVIKNKKMKRVKKWGEGFIGAAKGGPKNLSSRIDYYLYGKGNPKWAGR